MARRASAILITTLLLVLVVAPAQAALTYTTLDHPLAGGGGTVPYDLDGNTIVGTFRDAAGVAHAFTYDGTTWTTLDHPAAAAPRGTAAYGIDDGIICGAYVDATGQTFGYLFDGVTWTTLAHPPVGLGRPDTFARGISGNTVVGYYIEGPVTRGFVYNAGSFADLIVPGATGTFPEDVDGSRVVGTFEDPLGSHGFLTEGALIAPFDHPLGALLGTFGSGVDGSSVVGTYLSILDGSAHGFLFDRGEYIPVDYPGATDTAVNGINGPRLVGSYVDAAGATHGFLAVVPEPTAACLLAALPWWLMRRPSPSRTRQRGRNNTRIPPHFPTCRCGSSDAAKIRNSHDGCTEL